MAALSKRLSAIAKMVTPGGITADIGCDHALMPVYLIKNNISTYVFATDINEGPVAIARNRIASEGVADRVTVLKGDGLLPLKGRKADTVIIAGMGGRLMIRILKDGADILEEVKELILEPQSETENLRRFLEDAGYMITAEDMVLEDGKFYPVIKAGHGRMHLDDEVYCRYGRVLIKNSHPVLKEYLVRQKAKYDELLNKLEAGSGSDIRISELYEDRRICEKALSMMPLH